MSAFEPFPNASVGIEKPRIGVYLLGLGAAFALLTVLVYVFWHIATVAPNSVELGLGLGFAAVLLFSGVILHQQEQA